MINNTVSKQKETFIKKVFIFGETTDRLGQTKHPNNPCPAVEQMNE